MNLLARILLSPFALLYGTGVWCYNKLFDWNIRKSVSFDLPVISVGNLSAGGSGKTPHVEYLVGLLLNHYEVGVLSRGYKRRTKGFLLAEKNSLPQDVGDEPLQIKLKYPEAIVAVCEERVTGISNMLSVFQDLQIIILDDAFQHRQVKSFLSILLTPYSKPYNEDHLLPLGRLREFKKGADRADIIVVTKCPLNLPLEKKENCKKDLQIKEHQKLFFSTYKYGTPYKLFNPAEKLQPEQIDLVLLFCGIAGTEFLVAELQTKFKEVILIRFPDHHQYTYSDLKNIGKRYHSISSLSKIILTTEKDSSRLINFKEMLLDTGLLIYCQPIMVQLSDDEENEFNDLIYSSVANFLPGQYE
ncbi:MAG: tetraacyldisaccharide 4'-kinase [Chitinophagales bacterium]|nr:tetraacyldisaccharide 4'-kinase [Chitinophagales bacterium]